MKKIISIILALTKCLSAVALLASCGKSAYDIAVENGFEGTEKEWLESLQGQKGDKGDTGAAGAPGEKGDKGDKGDTGAAGAPGEKGDKGDKGDTGAAGANGTSGIAGVNGTNGREIEFRVTDTYIQWRYKTADDSEAWVDLVSLESLKGEKGDKGETGESGANGSVVDIIDGMWYIDGEPTGIIAGELKEDGSSVVVTCESITFSTDDCAIWKGGNTPSLKINYVLVNEAGEVVREGTTNVTANMISDVTPAFNGAGEYTATVKFLDKVAENVPLNITTEYELVKTVFTKGVEPKYQIKVTTGEDSYLVDVEDDMITDNKVDYTTVGKYPVTITYGGLAHTVEITIEEMMVYFANFDDIADGLTEAEILALTGITFPERLTADAWEVGVTGGRLTAKVTMAAAKTAPAGLIIVSEEYLEAMGNSDFTLQFDLDKLDANGNDTIFCAKYADDNPYEATKYTPNALGFDIQNTRAYISLFRSWNETGLHNGATTANSLPNYAYNKVWASGWKYDTTNHPDELAYATWVASTPAGLHVLNAMGFTPADEDNPGRWLGNKLTVKIVVKQMDNAEDTDWNYEIYLKPADAADSAFVKVYALCTSGKNASVGKQFMNNESNLMQNCFAILSVAKDSNWALDNIAIWTGTGEMPTITDTSVYEGLLG